MSQKLKNHYVGNIMSGLVRNCMLRCSFTVRGSAWVVCTGNAGSTTRRIAMRNHSQTPLNSSTRALRAHLMNMLESDVGGELIADNTLKSLLLNLKKLKDPHLTDALISKYVNSNDSLSQSDFTLIIQCFDEAHDPKSAWSYYNMIELATPSLAGAQPLKALLKALKKDPELAIEGIKKYIGALSSGKQSPQLRSDTKLTIAALSLLSSVDAAVSRDSLKQIKQLVPQVSYSATGSAMMLVLAGKCRDYVTAKEVYATILRSGTTPTMFMESALLSAALSANAYTDCIEIYERLRGIESRRQQKKANVRKQEAVDGLGNAMDVDKNESKEEDNGDEDEHGAGGLNVYIVQRMVDMCKRTGNIAYGLEIIEDWLGFRDVSISKNASNTSTTGNLNWPLCRECVLLLLNADLLEYIAKDMADGGRALSSIMRKNGNKKAKMKKSKVDTKEELRNNQLERQAIIIDIIYQKVLQALKKSNAQARYLSPTGQSRSFEGSSSGTHSHSNSPVAAVGKSGVPAELLVVDNLALLLAMRGQIDLLLTHYELQHLTSGTSTTITSTCANEFSHFARGSSKDAGDDYVGLLDVVLRVANGLQALGEWQQLISLCRRLTQYSIPHYEDGTSASARATAGPVALARATAVAEAHALCAVALLQVGLLDRALYHLSTHWMQPFLHSTTTPADSRHVEDEYYSILLSSAFKTWTRLLTGKNNAANVGSTADASGDDCATASRVFATNTMVQSMILQPQQRRQLLAGILMSATQSSLTASDGFDLMSRCLEFVLQNCQCVEDLHACLVALVLVRTGRQLVRAPPTASTIDTTTTTSATPTTKTSWSIPEYSQSVAAIDLVNVIDGGYLESVMNEVEASIDSRGIPILNSDHIQIVVRVLKGAGVNHKENKASVEKCLQILKTLCPSSETQLKELDSIV